MGQSLRQRLDRLRPDRLVVDLRAEEAVLRVPDVFFAVALRAGPVDFLVALEAVLRAPPLAFFAVPVALRGAELVAFLAVRDDEVPFLAVLDAARGAPAVLRAELAVFFAVPDAFLAVPEAFLVGPAAFRAPPDAFFAVLEAFRADPASFFVVPDDDRAADEAAFFAGVRRGALDEDFFVGRRPDVREDRRRR